VYWRFSKRSRSERRMRFFCEWMLAMKELRGTGRIGPGAPQSAVL
jgi:hypothetical protein